jgi:transcriptional regulator with XRE-family HTH domain
MGTRIRARRTALGLTQEELAAKLGLQKSAIAKYESGRVVNIKQATLFRMADILGCSPSLLAGWDSEPFSGANPTQENIVTSEAANLFRVRFEQALSMSGIKPSVLAKMTGISQATLSQYRSGYSTPKKPRLLALAQALGVSAAWLAGLEHSSDGIECDALAARYGEDALAAVELFIRLDAVDRAKITTRMEVMLEGEKYATRIS